MASILSLRCAVGKRRNSRSAYEESSMRKSTAYDARKLTRSRDAVDPLTLCRENLHRDSQSSHCLSHVHRHSHTHKKPKTPHTDIDTHTHTLHHFTVFFSLSPTLSLSLFYQSLFLSPSLLSIISCLTLHVSLPDARDRVSGTERSTRNPLQGTSVSLE